VIRNGEDFWKTSNASKTSVKARDNVFAKCSVAMMCSEFCYFFCEMVEKAKEIGLDITLNGSPIEIDSWIIRNVKPWRLDVNPLLQYKIPDSKKTFAPNLLITMGGKCDEVGGLNEISIEHQYIIIKVRKEEEKNVKSNSNGGEKIRCSKNDRSYSRYLVDLSAAQLNVFDRDEKGYYYSLIKLNHDLYTIATSIKSKIEVYNESKITNHPFDSRTIKKGTKSFLNIVETTKLVWEQNNQRQHIERFDNELKRIHVGLTKFLKSQLRTR